MASEQAREILRIDWAVRREWRYAPRPRTFADWQDRALWRVLVCRARFALSGEGA